MDSGNVEAGVGSIRTHPSTSPRVGHRRRLQGRRSESKKLDDSKHTANWGRPVQKIHEEVGAWRTDNGYWCTSSGPGVEIPANSLSLGAELLARW